MDPTSENVQRIDPGLVLASLVRRDEYLCMASLDLLNPKVASRLHGDCLRIEIARIEEECVSHLSADPPSLPVFGQLVSHLHRRHLQTQEMVC